jgi:hypothetical protein
MIPPASPRCGVGRPLRTDGTPLYGDVVRSLLPGAAGLSWLHAGPGGAHPDPVCVHRRNPPLTANSEPAPRPANGRRAGSLAAGQVLPGGLDRREPPAGQASRWSIRHRRDAFRAAVARSPTTGTGWPRTAWRWRWSPRPATRRYSLVSSPFGLISSPGRGRTRDGRGT